MVEEKLVVAVFRRLCDGDPVKIEKNSRCSSDVWLDHHCPQVSLVGAKEMFVQGWLRKEIFRRRILTSAFNSVQWWKWSVSCRLLACIGTKKKNPLELRLRSVEKTSVIWASDFLSVVAACLLNGLIIKKHHWNTAFYGSNFQDFQNFLGRCKPPKTPSWSEGRFAPCCAWRMHAPYIPKFVHKPLSASDQLRPCLYIHILAVQPRVAQAFALRSTFVASLLRLHSAPRFPIDRWTHR